MFPIPDLTWTGAAGENFSFGQCYLNNYLYTDLFTDPAQVKKIDPTTMITVDSWTGAANEKFPGRRGITTDGTHIYVTVTSAALPDTVPADVVKINPTTMATVDKWTGANLTEADGEDLVYDAPYLYLVLSPNGGAHPVKVVRINPTTMATVDSWSGAFPVEIEGQALTIMGNYFYVSCASVPALVIKVNKTTMLTDSIWSGDISDGGWIEGLVMGLTNDGINVYAGTYNFLAPNPTRLIKIDPATMTTVSKYQGVADELRAYGLIHYNGQVYMGLSGNPNSMILRVDTSTMALVDRWDDAGENTSVLGFCLSNPTYLFAGLNKLPADILKFPLPSPAVGGGNALPLISKLIL